MNWLQSWINNSGYLPDLFNFMSDEMLEIFKENAIRILTTSSEYKNLNRPEIANALRGSRISRAYYLRPLFTKALEETFEEISLSNYAEFINRLILSEEKSRSYLEGIISTGKELNGKPAVIEHRKNQLKPVMARIGVLRDALDEIHTRQEYQEFIEREFEKSRLYEKHIKASGYYL